MATCSRAEFIITNIAASPRCGSPISQPVAPSKLIAQVALPLMPIFFSMPSQRMALRVPSGRNFGARNSEMPLVPGGASGRRASTRCTMFSVRSCSPPEMKILLPVRRVAAIRPRLGLGAQQAEVAAGLRLGQVHRRQPFAADQLRQVARLQLFAAVRAQAFVGAVQQPRVHGPAVVGGGDHFVQRRIQQRRQALAAIVGVAGQRRPAALRR